MVASLGLLLNPATAVWQSDFGWGLLLTAILGHVFWAAAEEIVA